MNILLIGNKATFETYVVACYYLGQELDQNVFGNIDLEKRKEPIWVGTDSLGNQVYTLGNAKPDQVVLVNEELQRVNKHLTPLWVAPIKTDGILITVILAKLAGIPLIGAVFRGLAGTWVSSHRQELKRLAQSLSPPRSLTESSPAAKPMPQ